MNLGHTSGEGIRMGGVHKLKNKSEEENVIVSEGC